MHTLLGVLLVCSVFWGDLSLEYRHLRNPCNLNIAFIYFFSFLSDKVPDAYPLNRLTNN